MTFTIRKSLLLFALVFCTSLVAHARYTMNASMAIADLLQEGGDLYLFRYISQRYVPGKLGIVTQHTGLISYTINPLIFLNGQSFGFEPTEPQILISRFKSTEGLCFVDQHAHGLCANPLQLWTTIGEFGFQYEVEVPVGRDEVILVLPMAEFLEKVKDTGNIGTPAEYREFLRKLLPQ